MVRRHICAGDVSYVVLDEADKMLSLGFKAQLDQIWTYIVDAGKHRTEEPRQRPQVQNSAMRQFLEAADFLPLSLGVLYRLGSCSLLRCVLSTDKGVCSKVRQASL